MPTASLLQQLAEGEAGRQRLGCGRRNARAAGEGREGVRVVHADRVLVPERLDLLQRLGDADGGLEVPAPVQLDGDLHLHTDRVADLPERLHPLLDLRRRDVLPVRRVRELVEGPDLHRRDAHVEQRLGDLARTPLLLPGDQVLILPLVLPEAPARREAATGTCRAMDMIAIAGAGVVDADTVPHRPAEALIDRQADALAEDVPERDVERGDRPHLGAHRAMRHVAAERHVVLLDSARVLTEQIGRDRLVDIPRDRRRTEAGLTEADDSLIGMDYVARSRSDTSGSRSSRSA